MEITSFFLAKANQIMPLKPAESNSTALICSGWTSWPSLHCCNRKEVSFHTSITRNKQLQTMATILIFTSALKMSIANPLKQLMTACWMSNPRLSIALMVESNRPGLRAQNMWIFTALPSRKRTSTYTKSENNNCKMVSRKLSIKLF